MELEIKEVVMAITTLGGWMAFFLAIRHQSEDNAKSIASIDQRLGEKKLQIIELQKHSTKLMHIDAAEARFVSKRELELLLKHIDHKLDKLIDRADKREGL